MSGKLSLILSLNFTSFFRTKANESILLPNSNSHSTELIDSRKACSSTFPRKPVDNLNAQFFCEKSTRQDDLKKNNVIERQLSLNDENKQETTNDENKESSKKVGGYTRPKTSKRSDFSLNLTNWKVWNSYKIWVDQGVGPVFLPNFFHLCISGNEPTKKTKFPISGKRDGSFPCGYKEKIFFNVTKYKGGASDHSVHIREKWGS